MRLKTPANIYVGENTDDRKNIRVNTKILKTFSFHIAAKLDQFLVWHAYG